MTNFRYNAKPTLSKDPLNDDYLQFVDIHSGDYGSFDSQCDSTMVGFVQSIPSVTNENYSLTQHKAVCFYGEQLKNDKIESTQEVSGSQIKYAKIKSHSSASSIKGKTAVSLEEDNVDPTLVQMKRHTRAHNRRSNPHHDHVPSDEMDLLIETINSENSISWSADTCKL